MSEASPRGWGRNVLEECEAAVLSARTVRHGFTGRPLPHLGDHPAPNDFFANLKTESLWLKVVSRVKVVDPSTFAACSLKASYR